MIESNPNKLEFVGPLAFIFGVILFAFSLPWSESRAGIIRTLWA